METPELKVAADLDMVIVVPSRRRSKNMETIRRLLPTALICVDEREQFEYSYDVPESHMLLHPPFDGFYNVMNWMTEHVECDTLVIIDDDLKCVRSLVGSGRKITDPEEILALLENAARAIRDLDMTCFTFTRTANPTIHDVERVPIKAVSPICGAFGVRGAAKERRYDPQFAGRNSPDFTCETLLHDRCIFADMRYYFDLGASFAGRGGNTGLIDNKQWTRATRRLQSKWGASLRMGVGKGRNITKNVESCSIVVGRRNPSALK